MPVRLIGGLETSGYWREVRSLLTDLVGDSLFRDLTLELRPVTAADMEHAQEDGEDEDDNPALMFIDFRAEQQLVSVAVPPAQEDDTEPKMEAAIIFDLVDQTVDPDEDDDEEDDVEP